MTIETENSNSLLTGDMSATGEDNQAPTNVENQPPTTPPTTEDQLPETTEQTAGFNLDNYKDDPAFEGIDSVEKLAEAYKSRADLVGKESVNLPNKDSSDEDWQKFYNSMGRPEKADDYKFERSADIPEEFKNDAEVKDFLNTFYDLGLSEKQVTGIMAKYDTQMLAGLGNAKEAINAQFDQNVTNLKAEWGDEFKSNLSKVNFAFSKLDPEGALNEAGLGSNPAVIKILLKASENLGADKFVGNNVNQAQSVNGIEGQIKDIMNNPAYFNNAHADHESLVTKMADLQKTKAQLQN